MRKGFWSLHTAVRCHSSTRLRRLARTGHDGDTFFDVLNDFFCFASHLVQIKPIGVAEDCSNLSVHLVVQGASAVSPSRPRH